VALAGLLPQLLILLQLAVAEHAAQLLFAVLPDRAQLAALRACIHRAVAAQLGDLLRALLQDRRDLGLLLRRQLQLACEPPRLLLRVGTVHLRDGATVGGRAVLDRRGKCDATATHTQCEREQGQAKVQAHGDRLPEWMKDESPSATYLAGPR